MEIKVKCEKTDGGWDCDVKLIDGEVFEHGVFVSGDDYEKLSKEDCSVEDLVEASFRFLLDREPKGSILKNFNLNVILKFFPEYKEKIKGYL
ncbi:MAG: hypothetical protein WDZ69_03035 [Candidatus Pacearchaeota archaeon]